MSTKHTPGPWVRYDNVTPPMIEGTCFVNSSSGPIVTVHYNSTKDEVNRANANLVGAAPELLEALQSALCALEVCGKSYDHTMDKARAAIRKANGEEA